MPDWMWLLASWGIGGALFFLSFHIRPGWILELAENVIAFVVIGFALFFLIASMFQGLQAFLYCIFIYAFFYALIVLFEDEVRNPFRAMIASFIMLVSWIFIDTPEAALVTYFLIGEILLVWVLAAFFTFLA